MQLSIVNDIKKSHKSCDKYEGVKRYVDTGNVQGTKIVGFEEYSYDKKPSRANVCVSAGDVLVAKMQNSIKVLLIDEENEDYVYSTGFYAFRDERILPAFLKHFFLSPYFNHEKDIKCTGGTQKAINDEGMKKIFINVPSLEEQKEIVGKLDLITEAIECEEDRIQLYDELIKSKFVEMFGDVIANTKNWDKYRLSDISTSRLGKMLDSKKQTGKHQFPYLANFNVQWFSINTTELNTMDFDEAEQIEFHLEEGDLLVCEGGEVGRCAIWHNELQPCYFQKALHRIKCNREIIVPEYLAWWFKYNCDHKGFDSVVGTNATIAHLPGVKLKALQVAVPPIELQNEYAVIINNIQNIISTIRKSKDYCIELLNSEMNKWFDIRKEVIPDEA